MADGHSLGVGQALNYYTILGLLGAGGMGEVYLAEDTRLKRRVALKVLPVELTANRDRLRRFEQEARAASALNHPNIVTIHEIGQTDHRGLAPFSLLCPLSQLGLGRAAVLTGDTAKARQAYQDFFALWKDADPDLPILITAKKEYAGLK